MGIEALEDAWMERIAELSQGQPAYLEEVCRTLVDSGALQRVSAQKWRCDERELVTYSLPSGLRESFRRRLNGIGAAGRELLELMVVLDRPVEWSVLRALAVAGGEDAADVDRVIDTLRWRHFVLVELEMSGRYVRFIHPAVKHVVELLLSPEWRRALHRRVGGLLRERWRLRGGDIGEVARHLAAGGRTEEAAQMAWAEGQVALRAGQWRRAVEAFELASSHEIEGPDGVLFALDRGRAALAMLDTQGGVSALERAVEGAEGSGLDWLLFHALVRAASGTASLGEFAGQERWIGSLRDCLPVMVQQPRYLESSTRLAISRGELDEALERLELARSRYEHFGNLRGQMRCASLIATIAAVRGDGQAAGQALQQAYDLARGTACTRCWARR